MEPNTGVSDGEEEGKGGGGGGGGGNVPQSFMCLAKFYTHKNYQVLLYSNERVQNIIEHVGGVYHVLHS